MTDTLTLRSARPAPNEHAPYYGTYVSRVPDGDIVDTLAGQIGATLASLRAIPDSLGGKRYAEGKWSIREVIGHLADAERVFGYRAMRFARADQTELPGFDENAFVANASFDQRTLASLCDEYAAVRAATVQFYAGLTPEEWNRSGTANRARMSVRALAWVMAGHELHHLNILSTRYL
ncbi:MAG: DinB family protein [Gemmatimonadaceae bacterium]